MNIRMTRAQMNVLVLNYIKGFIEEDVELSEEDEKIFVDFITLLKGKSLTGFMATVRPNITSRDKLNWALFRATLLKPDDNDISWMV